MTYDQFAAKVAERLGVEPTHLRFTTVNPTSGRPKQQVKRNPTSTLNNILFPTTYTSYTTSAAPRSDHLLYEILELSLSELESRKIVKVSWLPEGISKEVNEYVSLVFLHLLTALKEPYDIFVQKNGNISDLLEGLQQKAKIPDDVMQKCRVYEAHQNKFYKDLPLEHNVLSINEFFAIYVERIPDEELEEENPRYIYVLHFDKELSKIHGIPFKFIIKEGEVFKDTKERLSKRTGIKGKQFDKIRFALIPRSAYPKPEYLNDGEFLLQICNRHSAQLTVNQRTSYQR
jgi:ubiquitin carboxyl-terminal hydrolase 7